MGFCAVVWWKFTEVSEVFGASIIRALDLYYIKVCICYICDIFSTQTGFKQGTWLQLAQEIIQKQAYVSIVPVINFGSHRRPLEALSAFEEVFCFIELVLNTTSITGRLLQSREVVLV